MTQAHRNSFSSRISRDHKVENVSLDTSWFARVTFCRGTHFGAGKFCAQRCTNVCQEKLYRTPDFQYCYSVQWGEMSLVLHEWIKGPDQTVSRATSATIRSSFEVRLERNIGGNPHQHSINDHLVVRRIRRSSSYTYVSPEDN